VPALERKEWFCNRCKSEWTQMEVLDKFGPQGFLCHRCGFLLTHDLENNRGGHEQSTKMSSQFKFITELLPEIDKVVIPENTFEQALASQRRVVRDATNPAYETAPIDASAAKPTAVRGMTNVGPTSISVTLTTEDGPTQADIAAQQARKEQIAAQNALPQHFTHSTITGEQVKFGEQPLFQSSLASLESDKKDLALDTPSVNGDGAAEIDDYFARLKAEQAKEAEQEQDEEYETDDEEDEFEDVVPNGTGSGIGTPASSFGDLKATSMPSGLASALKKSGSVSGSGTSTGVTSPVTGPGTPNDEGRPAKKVRIEEPAVKVEDEESEEEPEFEDVS
jgi:transcription initiation factor TFIIE subunit alpha